MAATDLVSLPEIGAVTARELVDVGIADAVALREVGAREAFLRIRDQLDPGVCFHLFSALECGVRGVRSTQLTDDERAQLRAQFEVL